VRRVFFGGSDMPSLWRRLGAFVPILLLASCGGNGSSSGTVQWSVTGVMPAVSNDLNGGDIVTITGTNFITAGVSNVTFDGTPGTDRQVLSETSLTVRTPPAPGGVPGSVIVTVISLYGGQKQLIGAYTYADSTPAPQTITPTVFTPTGAENFTISGSSLGPLGGTVTVRFQAIGSVSATVSLDGTSIVGRAPVSMGVPVTGPITVTVDTGAATASVPTTVTYPYTPPGGILLPAPSQTPGNASQPVRLADGFAVLCTAGPNGTWGNADDDIIIVQGPPAAAVVTVVPMRSPPAPPATSVGFLSSANSIPAVVGPDTFCVFTSAGGGGIVVVTQARTAPVADMIPYPGINAAPIAAVRPNRIAFMDFGADGLFGAGPGNTGDDLIVADLNLAGATAALMFPLAARVTAGIADLTAGPANFSIPLSANGDTVIAMGAGPDGVAGNADDTFFARIISTGTSSGMLPAPFLLGRPIPISPTLCAAPGAGANGTFGNGDDTLVAFAYSGAWSSTPWMVGQGVNAATAVVPYARIGNGIAIAVTGPTAIKVFTDPAAGTSTTLPFTGTPLLGSLGNGGLVAFGPGTDLTPMTGADDQSLHLDAAATLAQSFSLIPNIPQTVAPLTDADRAFAVSPGPDGAFGTPDDTLEIYQSRALLQLISASQLPLNHPTAPVTGNLPFVPIGPGWGLVQSPGPNGIFGNSDDQLLLASY